MTIAARNRFMQLATLASLLLAMIAVTSAIYILLNGLLSAERTGTRFFSGLDSLFLTPFSARASLAPAIFFPLFSLCSLLYILFAFEKTQTIEITFYAACVFVLSLESLRILVPMYTLWSSSLFFITALSRIILFCRIFITLSLLASILFTTGQTNQQLGSSLFLLAFFSFTLVNVVPFNAENVTSTYVIRSGYSRMILLFLFAIGGLAVLSYLIQGYTRGIREYRGAALGLVSFLLGYFLLGVCDSWLFFVCGAALLTQGSILYLKRIHAYYLWQ